MTYKLFDTIRDLCTYVENFKVILPDKTFYIEQHKNIYPVYANPVYSTDDPRIQYEIIVCISTSTISEWIISPRHIHEISDISLLPAGFDSSNWFFIRLDRYIAELNGCVSLGFLANSINILTK